MHTKIEELKTQNEEYLSSIEKNKIFIANSISSHEVEKIKSKLHEEIQSLKSEISQLQKRPHNERGAGRKHKATSEQISFILSLYSECYSQVKIAEILSEQSGEKWNKSTVRNIINRANN